MADDPTMIANRFAVDFSAPLPDAGGGLPAFLARDRSAADSRRVAIVVSRDASPRARPLRVLADPIDNLMSPLGYGAVTLPDGKGKACFVICQPPPGPPVSAPLNAWPDKALIELVLRPIAQVLDVLQARKITHRAIRPNNVFQAAPGQQVTLGAAWAAPPAMHQPAVFEPVYEAMCHPAGRGDGSTADDVYALGVLLLTLASGRVPMARFDDQTMIRWKLDLGSYAALTRDAVPSSSLSDLLRAMLADDPEHRPSPVQLLDPSATRGRRVATRPSRRGQRALMLHDIAVFDSRMLAYAMLADEKRTIQFLRNGLITQWLRRGVGDAGLAARVEELVRLRFGDSGAGPYADATLLMLTIGMLNPRMPLCWRGVALWPDALPAILAAGIAGDPHLLLVAEELLANDAASAWPPTDQRPKRAGAPDMFQYRYLLQGGGAAGLLRLHYALNPLLPSRAGPMAADWIVTVQDLLHFFEKTVTAASSTMMTPEIAAFVAARADRKLETPVSALANSRDANAYRRAELELLRELQDRYFREPLPALAAWVAERLRPDIERWQNRLRREEIVRRMDVLVKAGLIRPLLAVVHNIAGRSADSAAALHAARELARIDAELAAIDQHDSLRFAEVKHLGQAITAALGLALSLLSAMTLVVR